MSKLQEVNRICFAAVQKKKILMLQDIPV